MKVPEQFLNGVGTEFFTERGEPGQVDKDDRSALSDRLGEEARIASQPLLDIRSLELREQPALHREILRLPPAGPELQPAENQDGRSHARDRQGRVQPESR